MNIQIHSQAKVSKDQSQLFLLTKKDKAASLGFSKEELAYLTKKQAAGDEYILINRLNSLVFVQYTDEWAKKPEATQLENYRQLGAKICVALNAHLYTSVFLGSANTQLLAVAEGIALSNYQFLKYKSGKKKANSLEKIGLATDAKTKNTLSELQIVVDAVYQARTWVNEPQSYLDAVVFAKEMKAMAVAAGLKCEVLNKKQIEALKMGGLLAVNKGSIIPPTFTIMEHKPKNAKNKKPLVLVGKGVVYDTGGLSLKPTPNSMDTMKCDMAGGAAVSSAICAIAKLNLPYHVIALVPATDNRPGENAYTPGDVVTMYDGQTVEVLNTDAEGRMLLGDALAYAKKYDPQLVLDFATLTGAAAAAIGSFGTVCMGTADEKTKAHLKECGNLVHERLVEFPFWDDYANLIKSDLADMKNIGGPVGGAITAGKFLEKYTNYPWMHFDIAGPAYLNSADSYRGKQGTGVGVRLLVEFVKQLSK
ncbi:MAG: peptidase M17 [Bacteroidetes bacterium B1(2017)]|nr:MAG: peptidase M17 [Bacteroidetes bacterium B1(2017)]